MNIKEMDEPFGLVVACGDNAIRWRRPSARRDRLSGCDTVARPRAYEHLASVHLNGRRPTLKQIEKIYARYNKWRDIVWWYEHLLS